MSIMFSGDGPFQDPRPPFSDVLREARLTFGANNPAFVDQPLNTKRAEANALEALLIGEFWGYFLAAKERSATRPALGNLIGESPYFALTQEAYEHRFRSLDIDQLGRTIQDLLIDAIQSGYRCWEYERRAASTPNQRVEHAYSRLKQLIAEEGVTQGTQNVPILIQEGMGTSLGSIMACVRIIPELHENAFNAPIDRDTCRHLIREVFSLHTRLARAGFPIFMEFAQRPLLPGASSLISYDPKYFAVFRDENGYHFSPNLELTRFLERVVAQQQLSPTRDRLIQNCPALHARSPEDQSDHKHFIGSFYDWVMHNLETFYLGRF